MSEDTRAYAPQPADAAGAAAGPTAGQLLRQAREASGLHVAALAVALKVPVRKLEALEEDRLDMLHDAVFVRALASSVCRTLKIDPQPVLERLPQTAAPRLVQSNDGINTPFRAPGDGKGPSWIDQMGKPVFLAVFALLLGALVLVFLPQLQREEPAMAVVPADAAPPALPAVVAGPAEPQALSAPSLPQAAASSPAAGPGTTIAVAATPVRTAPSVTPTDSTPKGILSPTAVVTPSAAAANAATAAAAAASAAVPPNSVVLFRTSGESWVQVIDARGNTVLRRLMLAGETAGAAGALPLSVTVGSASVTQVQVRGKPFDLAQTGIRENVSRFEVK